MGGDSKMSEILDCNFCEGTGVKKCPVLIRAEPCPDCSGTGKIKIS
jgi:DnaJ-class molecular chaperone